MSGVEPGRLKITPLPDGGALIVTPAGVRQTYTEDELASYVVELVHQAHVEPEKVDERWLEVVKACVGEDRWRQAMAAIAAVIGE